MPRHKDINRDRKHLGSLYHTAINTSGKENRGNNRRTSHDQVKVLYLMKDESDCNHQVPSAESRHSGVWMRWGGNVGHQGQKENSYISTVPVDIACQTAHSYGSQGSDMGKTVDSQHAEKSHYCKR